MSADYLPPSNTPFGHPLRGLWSLDPGIRFLNLGSFGAEGALPADKADVLGAAHPTFPA